MSPPARSSDPFQQFADGWLSRAGVALDLSAIHFPSGFFSRMAEPARGALEAMKELEAGAIANRDEGRQVGHYWLRAPELAPNHDVRRAIVTMNDRAREFARAVHAESVLGERGDTFRKVLVCGIGGSALGPQFVSDALGGPSDPMAMHFLDNTDPDGFDRVFHELERSGRGLAETLTIVVSKSGETKETRNAMVETAARYGRAGLRFARHAVAITGEGSELDGLAQRERWLQRFPMWDWVGGRTSQTAAVGLVPAFLQGIDADGILRGAHAMDEATREPEPRRNMAMMLALAWHRATGGKGDKDMVILPYKDRLLLLSRYLQQLVMESLGKELDLAQKPVHQGIAVYGNKGSTDQHSYVQQLRDGVHNFFVTFVEVLRDREGDAMEVEPGITSGDYLFGFLLGTRRALGEKGRESITLTIDSVSPESVGALIALYERAVGFYASLVNINAYHQPGVQAGKKAAGFILRLQLKLLEILLAKPGELFTVKQLEQALKTEVEKARAAARSAADAATWEGPIDGIIVFKILEHLSANRRGLVHEPGASPDQYRYGHE